MKRSLLVSQSSANEFRRDHIDGVRCTSEARCSPHHAPILERDHTRKMADVTRPMNWAWTP